MSEISDVTLWPSRENYARFRAVCDDEVPNTFDQFEELAGGRMANLAEQGIHIRKVGFDPDRMANWCREHFGKVDSDTRKLYAGFIGLSD